MSLALWVLVVFVIVAWWQKDLSSGALWGGLALALAWAVLWEWLSAWHAERGVMGRHKADIERETLRRYYQGIVGKEYLEKLETKKGR